MDAFNHVSIKLLQIRKNEERNLNISLERTESYDLRVDWKKVEKIYQYFTRII